jgi:uncharacterized LabA/DUF88 family protein
VWYVDGFNLYHAVQALGLPILKWLDMHALAASYLRAQQVLHTVHFFTALNSWHADKRRGHVNYISALQQTGVSVHISSFDRVKKYCRTKVIYCKLNEEKQSDVGIAVQAQSDAYDGHADILFVLTADGDQIPTFKHIRQHFTRKSLFLVAPPGRLQVARELGRYANAVFQLTASRLAAHGMPLSVRDDAGKLVASRPSQYTQACYHILLNAHAPPL